jgi:hypothetical protein
MERVKIKVQPEGTGTEEDVVAGSIEKCYEVRRSQLPWSARTSSSDRFVPFFTQRALEKLGKEFGRGRQDDEDADVV